MPTLALKLYQTQALEALESYLRNAATRGAAAAFTQHTRCGYNPEPFGDTPCVCLRIPTGGGKTSLGAHAIGRMQRESPVPASQPLAQASPA